ncbi:MAG: serine/threonine protein kinase [Archangium sp.]|nr:serine/threonine protein kinase [Archangium sp.]
MSGDDPHDDAKGAMPTSIRDPVIGTEVSGYRVTARLGSGGMGVVYEGEQPLIGKRVAIKVLRHEIAEDPELVLRLVAEARAVNQVGHRGIIDVFGVGKLPDGRQCIVMELLDGEPLESVMRAFQVQQRVMPLLDTLFILEEVFSALAAAHTAGVIHRDLKPSNIFLCKQRDGTRFVKLLDFGIAKLGVLGSTPSTRASMMVGTPGYMAPEQASGGAVTPAMDLYAAGVVTFELLAGRLPFESDNVMEMLMKHSSHPPPSLATFNPTLPADLDALVQQLLAKQPDQRPRSAEEVRLQLVRLRAELMVNARQSTLVVESPAASTLQMHSPVPAPRPSAPVPPPPVPRDPMAAELDAEVALPSGVTSRKVILGGLALGLLAAAVVVMMPRGPADDRTRTITPVEPPEVESAPPAPPATPFIATRPDAPPPPVTAPPVATPAPAVGAASTPRAPPRTTRAQAGISQARPPEAKSPTTALEPQLRRIEANLAQAEARGEDISSLRREVALVRKKLSTASTSDLERLSFRLNDLEAESAP